MGGWSEKQVDVADVIIAGGGIIGLALGLELRLRGMNVMVVERGQAMRAASWAAGGMLAAEDPQNPPAMMELARLSGRLYPEWLQRIEDISGMEVPLRTRRALQWVSGDGVPEDSATADEIRDLAPGLRREGLRFRMIEEGSIDPRDLCAALPKAFAAAGGMLLEGCEVFAIEHAAGEVRMRTARGEFIAESFVDCRGAWAGEVPVEPVKGQMVELRCAPERLRCVVRAPGVYLIPRGDGRVAVGATIERVGFDSGVDAKAIAGLIAAARKVMPELETPDPLECWAGLRPGTPDGLPVMGAAEGPWAESGANGVPRCWYATGHYRDGILLAPATARVMAQAIARERTGIALEAFSAARFVRSTTLS